MEDFVFKETFYFYNFQKSLGHVVCGMFVPQVGIKPVPSCTGSLES